MGSDWMPATAGGEEGRDAASVSRSSLKPSDVATEGILVFVKFDQKNFLASAGY